MVINRTWNEKHLDYEIETFQLGTLANYHYSAWNEKNLDYEIETPACTVPHRHNSRTWNEKNLDYEIETWEDSIYCV